MSHRKKHRRRTPPGAAPGTLIPEPGAAKPRIHLIACSSDEVFEQTVEQVDQLREPLARWPVTWINVAGLGDVETIRQLADMLGLHQLAVEDTVNTHQRAKVEHYRDHVYIVAHMARFDAQLETEQLSLFLGRRFVITFQENGAGDPFEAVRQRIRKDSGSIRDLGADFLAYSLIDSVIDGYFPVLESVGEYLETLEDEVFACPSPDTAQQIHQTKRNLMTLRRAMWPMREAMNTLIRDPSPLVTDETRLYLRDCYDHAVRIIDFVETYRELGSDLMDLYLTSMDQRMTEVMKVLTIIATIFIPLTFIAGLYGMNFQTDVSPWNMPELTWRYGYPFSLGLMVVVAVGLVRYFRRKGWIGTPDTPRTARRPGRDDPPTSAHSSDTTGSKNQ